MQKGIINILIGIIIGLLFVVGIVGFFFAREHNRADELKARADRYSAISQGAEDALRRAEERYAKQCSELQGAIREVERLRTENGELRSTIRAIREELERIGATISGNLSRIEKCEILIDRIIDAIQSIVDRLGADQAKT